MMKYIVLIKKHANMDWEISLWFRYESQAMDWAEELCRLNPNVETEVFARL
jgi:hypothetical protein